MKAAADKTPLRLSNLSKRNWDLLVTSRETLMSHTRNIHMTFEYLRSRLKIKTLPACVVTMGF